VSAGSGDPLAPRPGAAVDRTGPYPRTSRHTTGPAPFPVRPGHEDRPRMALRNGDRTVSTPIRRFPRQPVPPPPRVSESSSARAPRRLPVPHGPLRRRIVLRWSRCPSAVGRPSPFVTNGSVRRPALYSTLTDPGHVHRAGRPNRHELDNKWRPTPRIWCFRSPHARLLTAPVSDDSSARRQTSCHGEPRGRS